MEIDTGAAVTLISEDTYKKHFPSLPLESPTIKLKTYMAEPIAVLGQACVSVHHKEYKGTHNITLVKGNGSSLLGRDWLTHVQLHWGEIRAVSVSEWHQALAWVLQKYANVLGGQVP